VRAFEMRTARAAIGGTLAVFTRVAVAGLDTAVESFTRARRRWARAVRESGSLVWA
jgi:hypothetical protein